MVAKAITIESVRKRVDEMSGVKIAKCKLVYTRHWGSMTYTLVFNDEGVNDRVEFERIQDVSRWLDAFEVKQP